MISKRISHYSNCIIVQDAAYSVLDVDNLKYSLIHSIIGDETKHSEYEEMHEYCKLFLYRLSVELSS